MDDFTIGRSEDNNYVINDSSVSSNHAKIVIGEDFKSFTLHDLNSTNGTKINGQSVLCKKIDKKTHIQLGIHPLNMNDFFELLKAYILKNRTDFSKEFSSLEVVEKKYLTQKHLASKYFKLKSGFIRGGITIGLLIFIMKTNILSIDKESKMFLMIGVGTIGGLISTASVSEKRLKHKLDDLYVEFTEKFNCPKCNFDLSSKSWKFWRSKKNCLKCNCKWVN